MLSNQLTVSFGEYIPDWETGSVWTPLLAANLIAIRGDAVTEGTRSAVPEIKNSAPDSCTSYSVGVPLHNLRPADAFAILDTHQQDLYAAQEGKIQSLLRTNNVCEMLAKGRTLHVNKTEGEFSSDDWELLSVSIRKAPEKTDPTADDTKIGPGMSRHLIEKDMILQTAALMFGRILPHPRFIEMPLTNSVRYDNDPHGNWIDVDVRRNNVATQLRAEKPTGEAKGGVITRKHVFTLHPVELQEWMRSALQTLEQSHSAIFPADAIGEGLRYFAEQKGSGIFEDLPDLLLPVAARLAFAEEFGAALGDTAKFFPATEMIETEEPELIWPNRDDHSFHRGAQMGVWYGVPTDDEDLTFLRENLVSIVQRLNGNYELTIRRPRFFVPDRLPLYGSLRTFAKRQEGLI